MTWTSHGYHIEGTPQDLDIRPVQRTRCGGPGLCGKCSSEQARVLQKIRERETRNVEEQWRQKPIQITAVFWDGTEETAGYVLTWLRNNLAREARMDGPSIAFEDKLKTYYLTENSWIVLYKDKLEIIPDEHFQYHFELDT